jgi:hypothetical protein
MLLGEAVMGDLLRFLFKGDSSRSVSRLPVEKPSGGDRFKLVKFFSWVLASVLFLCLVGVFVLLIIGREVPDFIPPIITAVIGYFGGAVAAYFDLRPQEHSR